MDILKKLCDEFSLKTFQVENTVKLIDDGIVINDVYYASCFFEKGGEYVLTDKKIGYSNNTIPNQFSSFTETVSDSADNTESGVHINPDFNEGTSQPEEQGEVFTELEKNIYLSVLIFGFAVVLVSLVDKRILFAPCSLKY